MIAPIHIPHLPAGTPEAVRRFALALAGVIEAMCRAWNANPTPPVPGPALWAYLLRLRIRFARLWPRLLAGQAPRTRAPRPSRAGAPRKNPRFRLPSRKAWLAQEIGWFGRGYAANIEHLLTEPDSAALIAASPRAQRLLRPFCRMLGLTLPALPPLPPRLRKPRPRKPKRLTRKQREAILWYPNSERRPMRLLPKKLPRD